MANLEDYLQAHSAELKPLDEITPESDPASDTLTLAAILLAYNAKEVLIAHLGTQYTIPRHDVLKLEDATAPIANDLGYGRPIHIWLKPYAVLTGRSRIFAADLQRGMPFVVARPSLAPLINVSPFSDREIEWRKRHNLSLPDSSFAFGPSVSVTAWSPTNSGHSTTTYANGFPSDATNDGNGQDDSYGDSSGFDD